MARPHVRDEDKVIETWESVIPGTVYVWLYDRRDDRYIKQGVGGRSSKRLHISRDDRKYNQELIPVENVQHDPFTNGALKFVEAATRDETLDMRYHLDKSDLEQLFKVRDVNLFLEGIKDIESELVLRRLADMAEDHATVTQNEALKDLIRERYPIGGSQPSMKEELEAEQRMAGTRMR